MPNLTNKNQKVRIPKGQGKDRLIKHSKQLFLRNGYESTSHQAIYKSSGVGQGSFYHYFSGKADLMKTVLDELCELELHSLNHILEGDGTSKEKLNTFLDQPRSGKKGCKFGRFVYESSIINSDIAKPIKIYFKTLEATLTGLIKYCQSTGVITQQLPPEKLSQIIIVQIQGGYILSRVKESDTFVIETIDSIKKLLYTK